ncbi:MAG: apolipoprotein N-acyltransferase [Candidatus Omnitrophica bacterium]|nr:apolipoprotein N-acyltransferase [Candidatus Omnitrophota bacterium]
MNKFYFAAIHQFVGYLLITAWLLPVDFKGYLAFSGVMGLQGVVFIVLLKWERIQNIWLKMVFASSLWALTEWLRMNMLGGFGWTVSQALAFHPRMIQIIDVCGAQGLSFIIVFVNCLIYFGYKQKSFRSQSIGSLVCVFVVLFGYGFWKQYQSQSKDNGVIHVCTVQPNIPPRRKLDPRFLDRNFDAHMELSRECFDKSEPEMIVWPEIAVTDDVLSDPRFFHELTAFAQSFHVHLLVGSALRVEGKDYNSAVFFSNEGLAHAVYHKVKLIPFSEYFPLQKNFGWLRPWMYHDRYAFSPGKEPGLLHLVTARGEKTLGVLICSEDGYPGLMRPLVEGGAGAVIVLLNDGWFQDQAGQWMHLQNSILRSIEFGRPILRSANTGISINLDSRGYWRHFETNETVGRKRVFNYALKTVQGRTFFNEFGDFFVLFYFVFVIMTVFRMKLKIPIPV